MPAAIDADAAATVLANQVVARLEGQGYETSGIPEALIAAFATRSPDPELPQPHTALACWDAAMEVIAYRIPGTIHDRSEAYEPEKPLVAQIEVNVAMARLALATIALPTRAADGAPLSQQPSCSPPDGRPLKRPSPTS